MFAKHSLACMLMLVLINSISAEYDVDGVCSMVVSGTRIASIDSCQKYYICNNGKATAFECPAGTKFSKNMQSCLSADNVKCLFGDTDFCTSKSEGFVAKKGTCNGYIYCKNGVEVASGVCARNLIFRNGECQYGYCPNATANVEASFTSICQVLPNDKYFGSTMNCGKWQICRKERLSVGFCENPFVFDVEINSCNYKSKNTCNRVTGANIQPDPETYAPCNAITDTMKATTKCSEYLKCEKDFWTLKSCPQNSFFDKQTQTCVSRREAVTEDCDRCQFSRKLFVNAVDPKCRKYLICENGVTKASNSCKNGYYFDESGQACVKGTGEDYAPHNGACHSINALV